MRKILLLHGTNGNAKVNWFPWLKNELESDDWKVWTPNLPQASEPNSKRYNDFIFANIPWQLDLETTIVGHSSGSVAAMQLLQALPDNVVVARTILIGAHKDDLGWPNLDGLFDPSLDFEKIRNHSKSFLIIHSDNDPYCPVDHAEYLAEQLHGELKIVPGQKHFSVETNPKYITFPLLKQILERG